MWTMALWAALAAGQEPGAELFHADFARLEDWRQDGQGTAVQVEPGVLRLECATPNIWWAPPRLEAPLEIRFDARTGDETCRAILFFMADGLGGEDILDWERLGDYGDYAYADRMDLYTVGLLRQATGTSNNLRRIGGILPERFHILRARPADLDDEGKRRYREAFEAFQPYSIRSDAQDGTRLDTWHRHRVQVVGGHLRVWVDDRLIHDHEEQDHPLLRGRSGFRNFHRGGWLELRDLSVVRPEA